jgi:hypothetical protein
MQAPKRKYEISTKAAVGINEPSGVKCLSALPRVIKPTPDLNLLRTFIELRSASSYAEAGSSEAAPLSAAQSETLLRNAPQLGTVLH